MARKGCEGGGPRSSRRRGEAREAEQPCSKGAALWSALRCLKPRLCHSLAWPLQAALAGRKLGKCIGSSAGASASGSFRAAGSLRPCK